MNEIVRNRYGVRIKVCCASCQHKAFDLVDDRICMRRQCRVDRQEVCSLWTMSDAVDYIRTDGEKGNVHKKEWLDFLVEQAMLEKKMASYSEEKRKELDVKNLREAWEKVNGSVYL